MRVLTDWATGAPPCVGWWLIRPETSDAGGSLRYWTGEAWKYSVKDTWSFGVGCIEWCGLAFNPESARYVMRWQDLTLEIEEFTL